jgi:hypothetical protein
MRFRHSIISLVFLGIIGLGQNMPPKIYTIPQVQPISTGRFIAGKFSDAEGKSVNLPLTGRYLMWLIDTAFLFEYRETLPLSEFEPDNSEQILYNPVILTLPFFSNLPNSYLVFSNYYGDFPLHNEWLDVAAQFPSMQVLFNDKLALEGKVIVDGMNFETPLANLLFMDGQKVAYVYPNVWEIEEFTDLIKEAAVNFLAGDEPILTRAILGTVWEELAGQPTLVYSISEDVLDADANQVGIKEIVNPDGSSISTTVSNHPSDGSRFLLERLTELLSTYHIRGVALLREPPKRLSELEQTFPAWDFIYLQTPQDLLRWGGIPSATLDKDGTIQSILAITIAEEERLTSLENALSKATGQE